MGDPARPTPHDRLDDDALDLDPPPGILSEDDPGFLAELKRRAERLRTGEDPGVPWEKLRAELAALGR